MELNLQTVYIHVYTCTACGEKVKVRIPLATGLYEYCPDCHGITLHRKEAYTVVESPTEFSEGLKDCLLYTSRSFRPVDMNNHEKGGTI